MSHRLPDFLIVGAMKSGTTTLYQYLESNPNVFMSTPKEPNFFSMDEVHQRGTGWYASLFADAESNQICGEASPSYSRFPRFPNTASRIANLLPNVKLIYLMRHPVDRFYSNYVFDRSYGFNDSIQETLDQRSYVLETSNYMLQIERYLEHFPREQMLFLLLEDLRDSPRMVLREMSDFLGIRDESEAVSAHLQANPQGRNYAVRQCNTNLQRLRKLPGIQIVKQFVPKSMRSRFTDGILHKLPDSRFGKWISMQHTAGIEVLTPELRTDILNRLAEPTARLEKFLGRDLSAWRA